MARFHFLIKLHAFLSCTPVQILTEFIQEEWSIRHTGNHMGNICKSRVVCSMNPADLFKEQAIPVALPGENIVSIHFIEIFRIMKPQNPIYKCRNRKAFKVKSICEPQVEESLEPNIPI